MNLSEKDTKIIAAVLIVVMCAFFYFVPYKQMDTKKMNLNNTVTALTGTYNQLAQDIAKKDEFSASIEETKSKISQFDAQLPAVLTQEGIISEITDLETTVGIKFPSVNLGALTTLFTLNEVVAPVPTPEGQVAEPVVTPDDQETAVKCEVTTSTVVTYSQLKGLMAYLYNNSDPKNPKKRIVLSNLQLTSNLTEGNLTANFTLSYFALLSNQRTIDALELGQYDLSKDTIFTPFPGYGAGIVVQDTTNQLQEAFTDLFISLVPMSADPSTVTVGVGTDKTRDSYVYADQADNATVEIEFFQSGGNYYYRYKVGSDAYPSDYATGEQFDTGQVIEIQVFSSNRTGSDDKSGANATIINKTDMPVNIVYSSEDKANPRLNIIKIQGDVVIR